MGVWRLDAKTVYHLRDEAIKTGTGMSLAPFTDYAAKQSSVEL